MTGGYCCFKDFSWTSVGSWGFCIDQVCFVHVCACIQLICIIFYNRFRHSNVVDMMGYACDDDMSAIVYAYMPNGSLYDKLHKVGILFLISR